MTTYIKGISDVCNKYKNYFFDLDGVFWHGDKQIPKAFDCLRMLRKKQNTRIFFITNSSVRNRQQVKQKFGRFKFQAHISQIFSSSYLAGLYIKSQYEQIQRVICVGNQSMAMELEKTGLDVLHLKAPDQNSDFKDLIKLLDLSRQAVVVGYDKYMNYNKLCLISLYIQNGLKLFGTNPDRYTMVEGYRVPVTGCFIKMAEVASGKKAQVIGKPNPFLLQYLIKQHGLKKDQCLMIGDNLHTDILFGNNCNIDTLMVLTGISSKEQALNSQNPKPTYYSQFI